MEGVLGGEIGCLPRVPCTHHVPRVLLDGAGQVAGGIRRVAGQDVGATHKLVHVGVGAAGEAGHAPEGHPELLQLELDSAAVEGGRGALSVAVVEEDAEMGPGAAEGGEAVDGDVGAHPHRRRGLDPDLS